MDDKSEENVETIIKNMTKGRGNYSFSITKHEDSMENHYTGLVTFENGNKLYLNIEYGRLKNWIFVPVCFYPDYQGNYG